MFTKIVFTIIYRIHTGIVEAKGANKLSYLEERCHERLDPLTLFNSIIYQQNETSAANATKC
jgi:hypothetical protein